MLNKQYQKNIRLKIEKGKEENTNFNFKAQSTLIPRARYCCGHLDMPESRYFAATCNIFLFNMHWDTSRQVKSSQNIYFEVKGRNMGNNQISYMRKYTSDNRSLWKRSTVSFTIIDVKYKNKSISKDGCLAKRCCLERLIWNMYDMHSQRNTRGLHPCLKFMCD